MTIQIRANWRGTREAVECDHFGSKPFTSERTFITAKAEPAPWDPGLILQGNRTVETVMSLRDSRERNASSVGKKTAYKPHMIVATKSKGGSIDRRQIDLSFLNDAARAYHISADPRNYVFVSLPIVTAGVPNRNMDCFTHKELTRFSPIHGRVVYKTFLGKPCHVDHKNQDPTKAKGIHLDASLNKYRVTPGQLGYDASTKPVDLWKVRILTGWCREKDPELVKAILRRERTGYSMGALIDYALCSIPGCGKVTTPKPCEHIAPGKGRVVRGYIAYDRVYGVNYIETSNLGEEPADPDAWETEAIWHTGREAA